MLAITISTHAQNAANHNVAFDVSNIHIGGSDYVIIPADANATAVRTTVTMKYRNNDIPDDGSTELKWESGDKIEVYEGTNVLSMPKTWSSGDQGNKSLGLEAKSDATAGDKQTLQGVFTNTDGDTSPIGKREFTLIKVDITVNGTTEITDDYLFGDSLGKSENPKADLTVAIDGYSGQWTAALSGADDVVTFDSTTLSDSSSTTQINIKNDHAFTSKETKDLTVEVTIGSETYSFTHKVDLYPVVTTFGGSSSANSGYLIGDSLGMADNPSLDFSVSIPDFTDTWSATPSETSNTVEFDNVTLSNTSTETPINIKKTYTFTAKVTKDIKLGLSINSLSFDLKRQVDLYPVVVEVNGTADQTDDFYIGDSLGKVDNPSVDISVDIVDLTEMWDISVSQTNSSDQFLELDQTMLSSSLKSTGSRIQKDYQFSAQEFGDLEFSVTAGGMSFSLESPFDAYPVYITINDTEELEDDFLFGDTEGELTNPKANISVDIVDYDNGNWTVDLSTQPNQPILFDQNMLTTQQTTTKMQIKDTHKFTSVDKPDITFKVSLNSIYMDLDYRIYLHPVKIGIHKTAETDDDYLFGDSLGIEDNPKADLSVEIIDITDTWSVALSETDSVVEFDDATLSNTSTETKISIKKDHTFTMKEEKEMKMEFTVGSLEFEFLPKVNLLPVEFITPAGDPVGSPIDAGTSPSSTTDGANEFTFNTASPGVLEINLKVKVPGIGGIPADIQNKFLFEIDTIGSSTLQWDAANSGGKPTFSGDFMTAKVKFTGLPQNNSDFGTKMTRIKFDGTKTAEEDFEVFFDRDSDNHPEFGTYLKGRPPNWFYYWSKVYSAPNQVYNGSSGSGTMAKVPAITNWSYTVSKDKTQIYIYDEIVTKAKAYGVGEEMSGIDSYISNVIHEEKHLDQITKADALLPTSGSDSFRYGWSWNQPISQHNHWKKGVDGEWGTKNVDDDGDGTADNAKVTPNFEPGKGDDIGLDHPSIYQWPNAWALPIPDNAPHPIESECVNAADMAHGEHKNARDDWGNPGKNHKTVDTYND